MLYRLFIHSSAPKIEIRLISNVNLTPIEMTFHSETETTTETRTHYPWQKTINCCREWFISVDFQSFRPLLIDHIDNQLASWSSLV